MYNLRMFDYVYVRRKYQLSVRIFDYVYVRRKYQLSVVELSPT